VVHPRVLVVDDDRSIRRTLEKLLVAEGYDVSAAADGRQALEAAPRADLVLLDLGLPELDGLEVLRLLGEDRREREARGDRDAPSVVVLTARDDMQTTVRAVQLGAYDYLVKPPDIDHLRLIVRRALESREATRTLRTLLSEVGADYQVGNIIGKSGAIREIYKAIGAVSVGRASVLISGESGTGKELVAKAIHFASEDQGKPFAAVNCTAFARDLLESELFGHVRGAFTGAVGDKVGRFELAGGGTLFLDEIAEIPLDLQAKLLRVLQERTFERVGDARSIPLRARIIAATHRDLGEMVARGSFREDLLYRLKVVEIHIPPLRDRPEDIPLLVEALLGKINRDLHKAVRLVPPETLALLAGYRFPGNVRELENMLTRAVVLSKTDLLEPSLFPIEGAAPQPAPAPAPVAARVDDDEVQPLRVVERRAIEKALRVTGWNKRRACALLEISRPTLDRKIDEYGLSRPAEGEA
jgi:DNA-binding NtrC family response regulator